MREVADDLLLCKGMRFFIIPQAAFNAALGTTGASLTQASLITPLAAPAR